jgi:hypothetical protein
MRPLYRLTGLISTLSLVATFLVASGFVCVSTESGTHMADMAGMDMGNMPMEQHTSGTGSPPHDTPSTPPASCDFPWAPSGCQSMAPCAAAASVAQQVSLPDISSIVFHVASASIRQPPSETIAPELPPPRA